MLDIDPRQCDIAGERVVRAGAGVAKGDKLIDAMRRSPHGWRMTDVEAACASRGIDFSPPTGGSHFKVKHRSVAVILTIPAHRPIKPVYIRELVKFIDAVAGASDESAGL